MLGDSRGVDCFRPNSPAVDVETPRQMPAKRFLHRGRLDGLTGSMDGVEFMTASGPSSAPKTPVLESRAFRGYHVAMPFRPLFAATVLLGSQVLAAQNWPEFRGPTGDGHTDATGLPFTFGDDDHVKWKTPIHGKAWSSPVIWGSEIWVTTANEEGTELGVVTVDKETGRILRDDILFHIATRTFGISGKETMINSLTFLVAESAVAKLRIQIDSISVP
jgi:hypothetical protein